MKGILEAWDGDAPAADMPLRADQALRAAAQEDFELYEASESDNEMMEVAADDTGEGKLFTPSKAALCTLYALCTGRTGCTVQLQAKSSIHYLVYNDS